MSTPQEPDGICPLCKKPLQISVAARYIAGAYDKSVLVVTDCCEQIVKLIPYRGYQVVPYAGTATEDSWGRVPKKPKIPADPSTNP